MVIIIGGLFGGIAIKMVQADDCVSHSWRRCWSGNVYWYDSCGNREDVADYCAITEKCNNDACVVQSTEENCQSRSYLKCWSGNVYWYDSCGRREKIYQQCPWGQDCHNGECVKATTVNTNTNSIVFQILLQILLIKIIPKIFYRMLRKIIALLIIIKNAKGNDVYWYDSCGNRGDLYQRCDNNEEGRYYCNGNWLEYQSNGKICLEAVCRDSTKNSKKLKIALIPDEICKNGSCVLADLIAPTIINTAPNGSSI